MNVIVNNVNLSNLPELNSIYACILYKGQGKDRESSRSYRTISTCPLVAKAIDCYIRELCLDSWDHEQASTQYQGSGMSHELACLLLTETTIFYSGVKTLSVCTLPRCEIGFRSCNQGNSDQESLLSRNK